MTNRKRSLVNQGQSEAKLLHTYGVELPRTNGVSYEIDKKSVNILNMYQPVMNVAYEPVHIIGDGNCLYRAASYVLSGHQNNHLLLRLMTALELINNRSAYDTKKPYNDFLHDCRIVTSDYEKIVRDVITENCYSEMAHVYALSAAIREPIQSYFPPQLQPELSSAFTRKVVGRGVSDELSPSVMIMWSSTIVPDTLSAYKANHFVPLISKDTMVDLSVPKSFSNGYGCETSDEPVTLSDISMHDLVTDSPKVSCSSANELSVGNGFESLDASVSMSDTSAADVMSVPPDDSNPPLSRDTGEGSGFESFDGAFSMSDTSAAAVCRPMIQIPIHHGILVREAGLSLWAEHSACQTLRLLVCCLCRQMIQITLYHGILMREAGLSVPPDDSNHPLSRDTGEGSGFESFDGAFSMSDTSAAAVMSVPPDDSNPNPSRDTGEGSGFESLGGAFSMSDTSVAGVLSVPPDDSNHPLSRDTDEGSGFVCAAR